MAAPVRASSWRRCTHLRVHALAALQLVAAAAVVVLTGWSPALVLVQAALLALLIVVAARRSEATKALRSSEQRFRSLVQHSADSISVVESDGVVRWTSPSVANVLGYSPESLVGANAFDLIHPEDAEGAAELLEQVLAAPDTTVSGELRLRHADGSWRFVEFVASNLLDDPSVNGIVNNLRDIGERKAIEARMLEQALCDPLTGLANRALFVDRLAQAVARSSRRAGKVAVIFLDVDRFKVINDSLGHEAGDQLLIEVASRLRGCLRPQDTVARFGGDEFTILLDGVSGPEGAVHVAERIQAAFQPPFGVSGREVFTSASMGIVVHDGPRPQHDLLRDADLAMYTAKERGRARYEVFDATMSGRVLHQLELETQMRRALERGDFRVHYQPVVVASTGEVAGFEALVRWDHADRGLVGPDEFIPLAEETGLIVPLGRWVLERACADARTWQLAYPRACELTVAVNLSARQLASRDLVGEVNEALVASGLEPQHLILEITESVVMGDAATSLSTLTNLDRLGVGLAIDDFGTGYSSLGYLKSFPVRTVKLDRSFIADLGQGAVHDLLIVETIVRLAHALGMKVVAEGVERSSQLAELRRAGCDYVQGFHFWPALTSEDASELLPENVLEMGVLG